MSTKQPQPEVQVIKLHKNANGMGLSIVAAKGAGQVRFKKIIILQQFFSRPKNNILITGFFFSFE